MLNALRLRDGFAESVFCERTGLDAAVLAEASQTAIGKGLIERTAQKIWRPTELGWRFLNDLQAEFLRKD
jgi:oxygen-independent coproporphyrinogen-3 oxidase